MSRICSCGRPIPSRVIVDGVFRRLAQRKYCLVCVPFRGHNNRDAQEVGARTTSPRSARFRRWQDKARRERKAALVALLGGRCGRCGYSRCIAALEFHHRDPSEKLFSLDAQNLLRRWEVVVTEARKCDLLCANCHREVEDELWRAIMAQVETETI